jgi:hypothetical protein
MLILILMGRHSGNDGLIDIVLLRHLIYLSFQDE